MARPINCPTLRHPDDGLLAYFISIFEAGIAEGVFRPDLDAAATASALMTQLRGLGYQGKLTAIKMDALVSHIGRQTEYWVLRIWDNFDARKA